MTICPSIEVICVVFKLIFFTVQTYLSPDIKSQILKGFSIYIVNAENTSSKIFLKAKANETDTIHKLATNGQISIPRLVKIISINIVHKTIFKAFLNIFIKVGSSFPFLLI